MEMKPCIVCTRETELRGIACPPCDAVLLVFSLVERHWLPAEMEQLRDSLREDSTTGLAIKARERGATLMVKLLWHIQALAVPAGLQPDDLKRRVCDALTKRATAQKNIEKFEREKGPDSYRLMVVQWVANELSGLAAPHKRPPEPTARDAAATERAAVLAQIAKLKAATEEIEPKQPQLAGFLDYADGSGEPLYRGEEHDRPISA